MIRDDGPRMMLYLTMPFIALPRVIATGGTNVAGAMLVWDSLLRVALEANLMGMRCGLDERVGTPEGCAKISCSISRVSSSGRSSSPRRMVVLSVRSRS